MTRFVKNSCPECGGSLRSWKCPCKPIWGGYTTSDTEHASTASAITDEQEAKHCPFCGSDDISDGEVLTGDADKSTTQSECQNCGALGPRGELAPGQIDYGCVVAIAAWNRRAPTAQPTGHGEGETLQARVLPWLIACFGEEIANDREERNHRFLEEALELVQSCGCTAGEAHQLVDYVFGRPVGEPDQEVGGVMITLAALCLANSLDMHAAGERELARIWTMVEKIRAKQAAKPKHSPLPIAAVEPSQPEAVTSTQAARAWNALRKIADDTDEPGIMPLVRIYAQLQYEAGVASRTPAPAAPSQHDDDSRELRSLCQARDEARRERDLLTVDVAGLTASVGHLCRLVDELRLGHDRYEYLRERPVNAISVGTGGVFAGLVPDNVVLNGPELDAAIDAAIEASTKGASS